MTAPLVDVHTHFMPAALAAALERRDGFPRIERSRAGAYIHYGPGSGHPLLPAMESLDVRLADMDRQGIDVAVLCVNVPGVDALPAAEGVAVAREANAELAAIVASSGGRIAALAVLPGQAPEEAASELGRAVGAGLCGGAVFSNVGGVPLDAPGMSAIFDAAATLDDTPLLLHPTFPLSAAAVDAYALIPTVGFLVDTTTAALRLILGGLYERHPDFKLVVPHTASLIPWLVGRIDYEGERMPNGFGALTEPPSTYIRRLYADIVSDWPPAIRLLIDLLGPERVMYGSDYPFWDPDRSTRALGEVNLDGGDADAVRGGTAARVFKLERAPAPPPS